VKSARSAGFQPAVSQDFQPAARPHAGRVSNDFNALPIGNRRYSRLETCATICRRLVLAIAFCLSFASHTFAADDPRPLQLIGTGITEPICDVTLSPAMAGIVSAWKVKEGDFVKEGDVILELDRSLEELEVKRRNLVTENHKMELDALQTLSKKNSISVKKDELDKAETEYKVAAAEEQIAAEALRRRYIAAPCSGIVAEFSKRVGEACQTYQPLARITDTRQCYLVSNVEFRLAGGLKTGQTVHLEIEAAPAPVSLRGKIIFLSPVVDPASGLLKVKVLFDNAEGKIRPGVAGRMFLE
jgi:RND family efflux transporter MFP subunit